jgi:hypothetical protein
MMHQHELFHFAADTMATQFEGILERPCHRPARTLKDPDLGYNVLEEELANAHMLRALRGGRSRLRVRGRLEQARSFVAMQPPGYRDAPRSLAADTFRAGCEALAQRYASCIPGYSPRLLEVADLAAMYPVWPSVDWRQCPIHLIDDSRRYALPPIELELFREIDEIEETATFRRDLAALPRELRSAWDRVKARLRSTTRASGMDFKQWSREEPGATVYSVRLNKGYRAHLRYDKTRRSWSAIAVGDHAAMGHG